MDKCFYYKKRNILSIQHEILQHDQLKFVTVNCVSCFLTKINNVVKLIFFKYSSEAALKMCEVQEVKILPFCLVRDDV